ncbi:hypothetical protein cypCar_00040515 [Cyprinus carpio]|nr:hypothetical protein cypCar_00040515 [Cyprinus carpio]
MERRLKMRMMIKGRMRRSTWTLLLLREIMSRQMM